MRGQSACPSAPRLRLARADARIVCSCGVGCGLSRARGTPTPRTVSHRLSWLVGIPRSLRLREVGCTFGRGPFAVCSEVPRLLRRFTRALSYGDWVPAACQYVHKHGTRSGTNLQLFTDA